MLESLITPVHLLIVFAIVVLLFGAKRLPELGKSMGSGIREFRSGVASLNEGSTDEQPRAVGSPTQTHDGPTGTD